MPAHSGLAAVFCANDLIALGLHQDLRRQRIRVPDELGRTSAQLLVAGTLGTNAHQHRQVIFEPELVVRPSSQMRARRAQLLPRPPSTAEAA